MGEDHLPEEFQNGAWRGSGASRMSTFPTFFPRSATLLPFGSPFSWPFSDMSMSVCRIRCTATALPGPQRYPSARLWWYSSHHRHLQMSFICVAPELMGKYRISVFQGERSVCFHTYYKWVSLIIGKDVFYSAYYWLRVVLHAIPCMLLLVRRHSQTEQIFTCKLGRTIKQAEIRKRSFINVELTPTLRSSAQDGGSNSNLGADYGSRRYSTVTSRCSPTMNSGRSLYATNRMLAVICSVFLLLEVRSFVSHQTGRPLIYAAIERQGLRMVTPLEYPAARSSSPTA